MIPTVLKLGPVPLNSFGLMVALAILAGCRVLAKSFERNGINPALADKYALTGSLIGLLGARLWYVFIDNFSALQNDLPSALFAAAGFTFYGGFIISTVVLIIMAFKDRISLPAFLDSVGPCLAVGYAIGRLGCQLSGDGDYGVATDSLWGMSYSTGVIPTPPGISVFPTPLYESSLALLILFILFRADRVTFFMQPLRRFGLYLLLIGAERLVVEFIRINARVAGIFSQAQVISLLICSCGIILIFQHFLPAAEKKSITS